MQKRSAYRSVIARHITITSTGSPRAFCVETFCRELLF